MGLAGSGRLKAQSAENIGQKAHFSWMLIVCVLCGAMVQTLIFHQMKE